MAALVGQHALVTGGSRGIGLATAAAMKAAGAHVTILGRDDASLRQAVAAGKADGHAAADVTDETALFRAIEAAEAAHGPVDILVANAGAAESAPFLKSDAALFRRMLDLNLMGVVNAIHAVLPGMLERGHGRIIAIASTAGLRGYPYVSAYTAAKHAVVGLVRALAIETAKAGVTVNALCPGYTETDLVRHSIDRIAAKTGRDHAAAMAEILKDKPLGRLVKPEEVAATCVFLAGAGAGAITGTTITVAGGEI
jgi:NAD(P)-dependent dehydrogenase (short-subunit alcohol dehydrogenase family)